MSRFVRFWCAATLAIPLTAVVGLFAQTGGDLETLQIRPNV
jgi:hypothetical protein